MKIILTAEMRMRLAYAEELDITDIVAPIIAERDALATMHIDTVRHAWESRNCGSCEELAEKHDALAAMVVRWKAEYIEEVRKHVRLHNKVYSGEFGKMPEGSIYSEDYVVNDSIKVIESEIENPQQHLRDVRADAVEEFWFAGAGTMTTDEAKQYAASVRAGEK